MSAISQEELRLADAGPSSHRSPKALAWRRFARNRAALVSLCVLAAIVLLAIVVPLVYTQSPNTIDVNSMQQPPSADHWFGTDSVGRDVFARVWSGARVSLVVGFMAAALSVIVGGLLGALAGLRRGAAEHVIMRVTDITITMPGLLVILVLAGIFGPSVKTLIIGIAVTQWAESCRVAHGVTLSSRERDYVQAAVCSGARSWWLLRKHTIPAALPPLTVTATLAVAFAILTEAALSFLGLGVQPPQASWGNMLTDAQNLTIVQMAPWMWLAPGLAISATVLAVNFIGDGLRDAFDPRQMMT